MRLQPFLELGKQITDSPLCEIDIIDGNYQWLLAHKETSFEIASTSNTIYDDTLMKSGSHEVEDLSIDSRYLNHQYVKGAPFLRHYFGVKLTTSGGKDIGTMSVSDPVAKRLTKEQKVQFKLLSHAVMMTIESEYSQQYTTEELGALKSNLQRLNHDVRSPINGITGLADLIIGETDNVNVRTRDILLIKESARSIIDIINDVATAGAQEVNEVRKEKSTTVMKPLSYVLDKIEKLFNPLAQNKNVTLSLSNEADSEIELPYQFSIKLLRIVGNLVSNAIKFSPKYGTVHILFTDTGNSNPAILDISVNNTGESMSSEQIQSFNSGDPVARTNGHGGAQSFGLGLQHVYQMVAEEGGSVDVENREVSETSFSIILPVPEVNMKTEKKKPFVNIGYAKPTVNGKDKSQKRAN